MGVIYTLAISNFSRLSDESEKLNLGNLKEYLISQDYDKSAQLLCLDDCAECDIYLDGNKTQTIEGLVDNSVRTYRYEQLYGFVEKKKDVFFNADDIEENVCFSYTVDKSGIGEQMLIEYKNKYYDTSTYLEPTVVYNSIEDAQEAKENLINEVLR